MSMAGDSGQSRDEYVASLMACSEGAYDRYWQTFAKNAAAAGRTGDDTVISLAHEFNGTWFPWNPSIVGIAAWRDCWRHVYSAIKSGSDLRVIWVFSASANTVAGGDYALDSAWQAYPGDDFVDLIGIDRYDLNQLGARDNRDWRATCDNPQDLCAAAKYAREHDKRLGVPEWSIQRDAAGYGDNPAFIDMMHGFFVDNADILAFESQFNNYGDGDWSLYPAKSDNALAAARYQALWSVE
jgi:hypothetical protein